MQICVDAFCGNIKKSSNSYFRRNIGLTIETDISNNLTTPTQ